METFAVENVESGAVAFAQSADRRADLQWTIEGELGIAEWHIGRFSNPGDDSSLDGCGCGCGCGCYISA